MVKRQENADEAEITGWQRYGTVSSGLLHIVYRMCIGRRVTH